jgi:hypothetical protein
MKTTSATYFGLKLGESAIPPNSGDPINIEIFGLKAKLKLSQNSDGFSASL